MNQKCIISGNPCGRELGHHTLAQDLEVLLRLFQACNSLDMPRHLHQNHGVRYRRRLSLQIARLYNDRNSPEQHQAIVCLRQHRPPNRMQCQHLSEGDQVILRAASNAPVQVVPLHLKAASVCAGPCVDRPSLDNGHPLHHQNLRRRLHLPVPQWRGPCVDSRQLGLPHLLMLLQIRRGDSAYAHFRPPVPCWVAEGACAHLWMSGQVLFKRDTVVHSQQNFAHSRLFTRSQSSQHPCLPLHLKLVLNKGRLVDSSLDLRMTRMMKTRPSSGGLSALASWTRTTRMSHKTSRLYAAYLASQAKRIAKALILKRKVSWVNCRPATETSPLKAAHLLLARCAAQRVVLPTASMPLQTPLHLHPPLPLRRRRRRSGRSSASESRSAPAQCHHSPRRRWTIASHCLTKRHNCLTSNKPRAAGRRARNYSVAARHSQ